MKLRCRHRLLKLVRFDHLAEKLICVQQHRVIKENVVDAHDFFFAQDDVRRLRVAFMHRQTNSEMRIVIKVGAGRNNPVDKACFD